MSASIALNRLGLGARPGERAALSDPLGWAQAQLQGAYEPPEPIRGLPNTVATMRSAFEASESMDRKALKREAGARLVTDTAAWWQTRLLTQEPVRERWIAFWSNHFTVSARKKSTTALWGTLQRDVVAPLSLGRFEDLLLGVVQHPAMLLYLDNQRSIGPNSRAGRRGKGLNENLAREILELHTLGVDGGYTQADILALARVITGWTVARNVEQLQRGGFRFAARAHEPGAKTLLGQRVEEGLEAGEAAIRGLARHPSTARHLCRKLAVHYAGPNAPVDLHRALVSAWMETSGDLGAVAQALVGHPQVWRPGPVTLKTPQDLVTSLWRALSATSSRPRQEAGAQARKLGQPLALAPSPAGWEDTEEAWLGPEGLLGRVDLAVQFGTQAYRHVGTPRAFAEDLVGPLSKPTRNALASASARHAMILFFASPDWQRR